MKRFNLLSFILGFIIACSIGVLANTLYNAVDVKYTPSDSSWNVSNVEDAISSLNTDLQTPLINKMDFTSTYSKWQGDRTNNASITLTLDKGSYMLFIANTVGTSNSTVRSLFSEYNATLTFDGGTCTNIKAVKGTQDSTGTIYGFTAQYAIFKCVITEDNTVITNKEPAETTSSYSEIIYMNAVKIE